jgi:5-formyltetrahydrofolate cyclo-ligase
MGTRDGDHEGPDFASPACSLYELGPDQGGMTGTSPAEQRSSILRWRKAERERLLARRIAIPADKRAEDSAAIAANLDTLLSSLEGKVVSLYWPLRGEPDLRGWLASILQRGATCALPVVAEKNTPLIFHTWRPGEALKRGFWNIPVPEKEEAVIPDIALAPVVGFDEESYRLGYGGGYFDRTLAAYQVKPRTIGVGFEIGRMETIRPQPHDIALDMIVTEAGVFLGR